jgi:hypothetical protein
MYSLIYLANYKVSWCYDYVDKQDRWKIAKLTKQKATADEMCEKYAKPLAPILEQICKIGYDESPDYEGLIQLFVRALLKCDSYP